MCITNVQYVAYNALYTMHIEMQIKTAFFLKHIGSTWKCTFTMCAQSAFNGDVNLLCDLTQCYYGWIEMYIMIYIIITIIQSNRIFNNSLK